MSHSKRNTSLAFFTAHERSLLRSSWGTQSTRLSRDSFIPFGYCRLCLSPAKDPVACGGGGSGTKSDSVKVHLFCRECALNDLMAQRKEIKRLEREAEMRERDMEDEKRRADEENRRQDLERFERAEMGFEDEPRGAATKQKRRAEEMHASNARSDAPPQKRVKADKESEASFWIPGTDTSSVTKTATATKLHALCPASTPESKHEYSLKGLVRIKFSEAEGSNVCPSCQKVLSNTSRPMLGTAEGCGHVICGGCADLFSSSSERVACYVCEADLSGTTTKDRAENDGPEEKESKKSKKDKKNKRDGSKGRLVEISCEGTGFAGGGANMAKRDGVAFQC
ncbi:hypothetical protein EDD36DRAFT_437711 [Exophiala viscosa]|uniref:RING-type domain-containing protein n=1 Tax=Exophiala viscosa TaxID=2486360 RepID=A0AAN6DWX6_9EURO|nr:hypothetical protein EDD36DRAFT_437711 [Exophiala viscosa]